LLGKLLEMGTPVPFVLRTMLLALGAFIAALMIVGSLGPDVGDSAAMTTMGLMMWSITLAIIASILYWLLWWLDQKYH
jgi:hypothetical protein